MPELPEVETVRNTLESVVLGKAIREMKVYCSKVIETDPIAFVHGLEGCKIRSISRKGKLLAFHFNSGVVMVSHLRMEGKYFYSESVEEPSKHDMVRFLFEDGSSLVYNDVRKFGRMGLYTEDTYLEESSFSKLGKEPFELTAEELHKAFAHKSIPLKSALLDQTIIAGIGNIYDDETLFAAKIHPLTPVNQITLAQWETILEESKRILNEAIASGGSTIKSYHPGKGIDGLFQVRLKAYGKENEPCPRCGFPMRKIFVGGRGTTYCPRCQINPTAPFVLGVTGPIHSGKSTISKYFEEKGYIRFDADAVAKAAYNVPSIRKQIKALLGKGAYVSKEADLAYIRKALTAKPTLKKKLEAVLHPYVKQEAVALIHRSKPEDRIVLEVPLLFPSGMDELCDVTLLVRSSQDSAFKRLEEEGRDAEKLLKINAGYPTESLSHKVSFVIDNDTDLEELKQKIDALPLP